MARISVEQKALIDRRFRTLGRLLGIDKFGALGRMIFVWHECQECENYILKKEIFTDLFPDCPGFVVAGIQAGLLQLHDEESVYVAGTQGRIEWLATARKFGKKYGHKGGRPTKNDNKITRRGFDTETRRGFDTETRMGSSGKTLLSPSPSPSPLEDTYVNIKMLTTLCPPVANSESDTKVAPVRENSDSSTSARIDKFVDLWNTELGGILGRCTKITANRKKKLQIRLTETSFADPAGLISRIKQSPFLCGETTDWKANIDWLIKCEDIAIKILEGKYDGNSGLKSQTPNPQSIIANAERSRRIILEGIAINTTLNETHNESTNN